MTKEEAIKIIDCYDIGFYDLSGEKIPANKLVDAFDMAIEALTVAVSREDTVTLNSPISIQAKMVVVVRCKNCDNRHTDDCPMYHEEWYEIDEGDGYFDSDFTVHDYSTDDGFCSWAKMKGGAE